MQGAAVKLLLGFLSKAGLKILISTIAKADMFQNFIQGLITDRVAGLKESHPETYETIAQYAAAVSRIPAILTDEDPNNTEQLVQEFRLKRIQELELALEDAKTEAGRSLVSARKLTLKV